MTTPADHTGLRDRIAAALYERERPPRDPHWPNAYAMDRETFEEMADAVLAVLAAPTDRAAVLDAAARHLYTALFPAVYADLGQKAAEGVNRAVSELRRLAGEAQQDPAQDGGHAALKRAHVALAEQAGRDQAALARIGQMADYWEQNLPEVIRTPAVVSAIRAALERAAVYPAAVARPGQPDTDDTQQNGAAS